MGIFKFFLGLKIACNNKGISLCQRKYTLEILRDAGMPRCKSFWCSVEHKVQLTREDGFQLDNPIAYKGLIDHLLYLSNTRPDIAFFVQKLSLFIDSPWKPHLGAPYYVLRYLKSTPVQGLFYPSNSALLLRGFLHSDLGGCPDVKRYPWLLRVYWGFLGFLVQKATYLFFWWIKVSCQGCNLLWS